MVYRILIELIAWIFCKNRSLPNKIPDGITAEQKQDYIRWYREHLPGKLTEKEEVEFLEYLREEQGIFWQENT